MYNFTEPYNRINLKFDLISMEKLVIPQIQRELSDMHVKRLAESILKIGFIEPITVVQTEKDTYEILNGQHRYHAAKLLNIEYLPAIVVPKEMREFVLYLNIEKSPNLRDKAHQAREIFHYYLSKDPLIKETELFKYYESAYYVTLGIIIEEFGDKYFPASAFESFLKRFDDFVDMTLAEAYEERKERGKKLQEVKEILNQRCRELGLNHTQYKSVIINRALQMEYGKKRIIQEDFYTALDKLSNNIRKVSLSYDTQEVNEIEF